MTAKRTRERIALIALQLADVALDKEEPKPRRKKRTTKRKHKLRKIRT